MKSTWSAILGTSGVAGVPPNVTPVLAAWMFAGSCDANR